MGLKGRLQPLSLRSRFWHLPHLRHGLAWLVVLVTHPTAYSSAQGYEVKTQGDSFMVAFQDASTAMIWALEVQDRLLDAEWSEDILQQESCEQVLSSQPGPDGKTQLLFRGLRVRVGIHTGCPEMEYNPRTNGVDYFGPTVWTYVLCFASAAHSDSRLSVLV